MNAMTGMPPRDTSHADVPDALVLLMADHDAVERLFDRLGDASLHDERAMLAGRLCRLLEAHATCEEELLYPAASMVLSDDRLLHAARIEHLAARELMRRVEVLSPAEPDFGRALSLLREHVVHHAAEEERALFPRLRGSRLDLRRLGVDLATRREELERLSGELPRGTRALERHTAARASMPARAASWPSPHHSAIDDAPRKPGGHAA
jgi:hemerythrin superfamily protein